MLQGGRLFNAAAVSSRAASSGVVPKTFLPGYKEYYEERWFSSAREAREGEVRLAGQAAPFGTDLLFQLPEDPGVTLAVEICEDLWAPIPPSSRHAVAGATVLLNPSASNDLVAKAEYRRELVRQQSGRTLSAYVYANAGVHESTTDLVFGGHLLVAENGVLLAEGERFRRDGELVVTDVDVERLRVERARQTSFADAVHAAGPAYRTVALAPVPAPQPHRLVRAVDPHPFVPADPATLDERCREVFSIQTAGLARRLEHVGVKRVVLGLSGGLDSTLALLVCVRTFDLLGLPARRHPRRDHAGLRDDRAHPGERAPRSPPRRGPSCARSTSGPPASSTSGTSASPPEDRESHTYQNLQARERTQVLMDLANMEGGIVVGTGDLSEIALGWATFAGDHIAMYGVNASVPKTLVRRLVEWVAAPPRERRRSGTCSSRSSRRRSRPSSSRPGSDGAISQKTEDLVGPYELHDFFLFCLLRWGAGPRKILFLAEHAFAGRYDAAALRRWLARLPAALLRPAVEALGDAGRAQGRLGEPVAPRRLADAERRRRRRPGCASSKGSPRDPRRGRRRLRPRPRAGRHRPLPPQRGAPPRLGGGGRPDGSRTRAGSTSWSWTRAMPGAAAIVAALRQDPITRPTAIVALGRSEFGFDHLDLLEAGANAILPLPPGHDWDDRLMRLIHVPVRRATRFPVDMALEGGLRERARLHRPGPQPQRPRAPARVPPAPPGGRGPALLLRDAGGAGGSPGDGHRGPGGLRAPLRRGAHPRRGGRPGPDQALRRVGRPRRAAEPSDGGYNRPNPTAAPIGRDSPGRYTEAIAIS